jgi:hypothetical protein
MARISITLNEDQYTFLIMTRSVLFRMRNVSEKKIIKENQNILCSTFLTDYWAVCEILEENTVKQDMPQMTLQYGAFPLHAG